MVAQRRKLSDYTKAKDEARYQALISKVGSAPLNRKKRFLKTPAVLRAFFVFGPKVWPQRHSQTRNRSATLLWLSFLVFLSYAPSILKIGARIPAPDKQDTGMREKNALR